MTKYETKGFGVSGSRLWVFGASSVVCNFGYTTLSITSSSGDSMIHTICFCLFSKYRHIFCHEPSPHPAQACSVKLLKPWALEMSATLRPASVKGLASDVAELAFWTSAPTTAGSTRGTMPRRAAVAGRLASLQMVGICWAKGLKFFSAATRAAAAAMTWGSLPSSATIWSASSS
jgi:hypothetical protein